MIWGGDVPPRPKEKEKLIPMNYDMCNCNNGYTHLGPCVDIAEYLHMVEKEQTWDEYLEARGEMHELSDNDFSSLFTTVMRERVRRYAETLARRNYNGEKQVASSIYGGITCEFTGRVDETNEIRIDRVWTITKDVTAHAFRPEIEL